LKSYFQNYTKARFDGVGGIDRRSLGIMRSGNNVKALSGIIMRHWCKEVILN